MVHNPHDALVKSVLAHPEHARGVLQSVIPAPLVETEIGPEAKDTIVTAAQRYIQQGESAMFLRLVRQRFGDAVDPQVERRIETASIDQLDTWTTRIFSAATLSELLAD